MQQELKPSGWNYVWQEQTVWTRPTGPAINATRGCNAWREKEETHTYTHNERTDGGTFTNTHMQTQTCVHWTDTLPSLYQCCCALYTQRGCQCTPTHLYSDMIMQCHAGTDYAQVSEGKARTKMRALKVGVLLKRMSCLDFTSCDLEMPDSTTLDVLCKTEQIQITLFCFLPITIRSGTVLFSLFLNQIMRSLWPLLQLFLLYFYCLLYYQMCSCNDALFSFVFHFRVAHSKESAHLILMTDN